MKAKKNRFFTVLIVSVYAITGLAYAASLLNEYLHGSETAADRFNALSISTTQNLRKNSPASEEFKTAMLTTIGDISDIAAIQVMCDGDYLLSYPAGEISIRSALVTTKSDSIITQDGHEILLKAAIYLLKPASVYSKGMVALLILAATTLICIFYLAYLYMAIPEEEKIRTAAQTRPHRRPSPPPETELKEEDLNLYEDEEPPITEMPMHREAPESSNLQFSEEEVKEKILSSEPEPSEEISWDNLPQPKMQSEYMNPPSPDEEIPLPQEEAVPQPAPRSQEEDVRVKLGSNITQEEFNALTRDLEDTPKPAEPKNAPQGLFSPVTGFGWEEYMLTRLDSELVRAASGEQDLTLMAIKILGIDWTSIVAKEISALIIETARFKDFVFNYKEDGCTAIFQGMDIDAALETAENLHTGIIAILARYGMYNSVSIGLSARSLRLISGSRLANEAEQALVHAQNDRESPIVAFKVNPEKYRSFLASESPRETDGN